MVVKCFYTRSFSDVESHRFGGGDYNWFVYIFLSFAPECIVQFDVNCGRIAICRPWADTDSGNNNNDDGDDDNK